MYTLACTSFKKHSNKTCTLCVFAGVHVVCACVYVIPSSGKVCACVYVIPSSSKVFPSYKKRLSKLLFIRPVPEWHFPTQDTVPSLPELGGHSRKPSHRYTLPPPHNHQQQHINNTRQTCQVYQKWTLLPQPCHEQEIP